MASHIAVGRGDDMHAVQVAHPLGSGGAGLDGSLHGAYVASDHNGHQAGADLLLAHQVDVGRPSPWNQLPRIAPIKPLVSTIPKACLSII